MQTDSNTLCRLLAYTLLAALLAAVSTASQAQETRNNQYRAEFVILERIVEPGAVNERMLNRQVETPEDTGKTLYSVARGGATQSSLQLVSPGQLHLSGAASRLERSGRYRVLMSAGWYESFPPGYEGQPLKVAIGEWLEQAGQREIEGTISIDRQRYLHVDVRLNHWQQGKVAATPVTGSGEAQAAENTLKPDVPLELLTWIRETRRMRSEEIHFLDSPTIGVLVFFKKVEATP